MSSRPPRPKWVFPDSSPDGCTELLESAERAWPRVLSYAHWRLSRETSSDERERLAVEIWERVLQSVSRMMARNVGRREPIRDLEAYLVRAFQHRLTRAWQKETRRQQTIAFLAPEALESLPESTQMKWAVDFDLRIQIEEIVARMDDWTRGVWTSRLYGYSWREIAVQHGLNEQQAKMRYRYAIEKVRQQIIGRPNKGSSSKTDPRG